MSVLSIGLMPILRIGIKKLSQRNLTIELANELWVAREALRAKGKRTDFVTLVTKLPSIALNDKHGIAEVEKIIVEVKPKSVVIDHKSACFADKESEDEPNHKWLNNLDTLAKKYELTYLVICQAPKGWRGDTVDLPSGSQVLTAWADTTILIKHNKKRAELQEN